MAEETGIDIRVIFKALAKGLLAEFEKTSVIRHASGKGNAREAELRRFLIDYLPRRYAVGQGQIIQSENRISRQSDIVIYDADHCPRLLADSAHSFYPIESVYGTVEVKSNLSSEELINAYQNIQSVKSLATKGSFAHGSAGHVAMLSTPLPVGVIFAYTADRSLKAVAAQVAQLNKKIDIAHAPDFIIVMDSGIVGPARLMRDEWNTWRRPSEQEHAQFRETKEYTLMGFYLKVLNELNSIVLPPLSIARYFTMPEIIGGHRVNYHRIIMREKDVKGLSLIYFKMTPKGVSKILEHTKDKAPISLLTHVLAVDSDFPQEGHARLARETIIEYNPRNLPAKEAYINQDGSMPHTWIDGQRYAIAIGTLDTDDMIEVDDGALDELFAL